MNYLFKTGFVLQGHILYMNNTVVIDSINYSTEAIKYISTFVIKMENVFVVYIYTDCTIITIKLTLVKYLSKILYLSGLGLRDEARTQLCRRMGF